MARKIPKNFKLKEYHISKYDLEGPVETLEDDRLASIHDHDWETCADCLKQAVEDGILADDRGPVRETRQRLAAKYANPEPHDLSEV